MTHQTIGSTTVAGGCRRVLMATGRIIKRHQLGFLPALIGVLWPRRQRPQFVALLTQQGPSLPGLVATFASVHVGD